MLCKYIIFAILEDFHGCFDPFCRKVDSSNSPPFGRTLGTCSKHLTQRKFQRSEVTSCNCFHRTGECRGALVTEAGGANILTRDGGSVHGEPVKQREKRAGGWNVCCFFWEDFMNSTMMC